MCKHREQLAMISQSHKNHNGRIQKQTTNFNKNGIYHRRLPVNFANFFKATILFRRSRLQMFFKIGVLKNFTIFNFIKKRLQHRCFPVNIARFLRIPFFTEHLWWMLLSRCFCLLKTCGQLLQKLFQSFLNEYFIFILNNIFRV